MSNIYIQEPPSNGKVLLKTTVGDIDIELWSKEAPKACRNFVQLCMEGYYDGTSFHRVVKDFIVQGGDPTDSGEGGESVYGAPFKDEFHTRLRFVRRGLVAMANAGPHDNGSQFFFTMGPTPELQNKHTIFGKVVGDTLYNMLKLQEVEVDEASERPAEPHKILSTEVLNNPFEDIVPRQLKRQKKDKDDEKKVKSKSKATKNFSLLSFGDEAEDDEEQVDKATESFRGKSKSSHDLTDDPRLSSVPAVDKDRAKTAEEEKRKKNTEDSPDEGRAKREEKKTEGEDEEAADKTESPKDESVKKNSSSPKDGEKRKSDSPEETKKPKAESKPEGKRKSRFEPLESEKKKSPEPVKTSSTPEDSDTKRRKTEAEGDSKKNVKDEAKEDSRKKRQESEPSQDSKKRKGDESHKEERKKRSKDTEDEERKKRKGDGKDEDGRKKRKGEEVKEEGKKKAKTEAVNSPRPTEDEKNTKDDVRQKLKKEKEKEESPRGKESKSLLAFVEEEKQNRMDEIKKEQRRLQRDIKDSKKRTTADDKAKVKTEDEEEVDEKKDGDTEENDLLALVKKERTKYKQRKKQMGKKEDREAATLVMLSRFQNRLSTARTLAGDYDDMEEEKTVDEETEDPDDMSWLRHKLHFEDAAQKTKVIDANVSDNDRYTLIDPRNPLNQRRRETSKRAMRDKR